MADLPFELRVVNGDNRDYGLALFQRPPAARHHPAKNGTWRLVAQISGTPLQSVLDQVLATLKQAGYRPADLCHSRRAPFALNEKLGVRLGLLFLAVKPLRKVPRMHEISEHIQAMTEEEAYYWFSKIAATEAARRAQKALRILLAKE
jgi:hypothetical protein